MVMNSCEVQGLLNLKAVGVPLPAKKNYIFKSSHI